MMLEFRPQRIIEVSSGFSSSAMIDVNERAFDGKIDLKFIEPYPDRLLGLLPEDSPYRACVRAVPGPGAGDEFLSDLSAGDILFIDSAHVSKTASDVNHLVSKLHYDRVC